MVYKCNSIAKKKLSNIKKNIKDQKFSLRLDIIYIGNNSASEIYVNRKIKIAKELGIKVNLHQFKKSTNFEIIKAVCNNLNYDPNCKGYFIQLPIPKELAEKNILDSISTLKDIDCLTSTNLGKTFKATKDSIMPASVKAIVTILKTKKIRLKSKKITIINDSNLIGKPLAGYLLSKGATVTICNEFTKNIEKYTKKAEVLITAVGKRNLIREEMVNNKMVLIDAGITRIKGKIYGDVDFNSVKKKVKLITPVPNGVGQLTIPCLFENLLKLYEQQKS